MARRNSIDNCDGTKWNIGTYILEFDREENGMNLVAGGWKAVESGKAGNVFFDYFFLF